jgi:protein TonB
MPELHRLCWERPAGLLLVFALHGAVFYGLWSYRVIPSPQEAVTLFVNFIATPAPPQPKPQPKPPKPVRLEKPRPPELPQPRQLVAEAPVLSPVEPVAPPPAPPEPEPAPPPAPPARPAGPVMLSSELAVSCPERTPPVYPVQARRTGEQGKVLLQVNLDEEGRVSGAHVVSGSGYARLDAAALAAIKTWRCQPARRDGVPVRAVALQPFDFKLEGY